MSWGGHIPGSLLNDAKFLETFEPYLPGMELVDEDEGEGEPCTVAGPTPEITSIYRVVDAQDSKISSYQGQHFYVTRGAARGQATKLNKQKWLNSGPFRVQSGTVSNWEDI